MCYVAQKMNNVCIFSHDQVTHDILVVSEIAAQTTARVGYRLIPI